MVENGLEIRKNPQIHPEQLRNPERSHEHSGISIRMEENGWKILKNPKISV